MFDEKKHPRDDDGKFTYADGSGGTNEGTEKERERLAEMGIIEAADDRGLDELLGKEFTGVKGQAAVEKLLQEKQGHVKGAFHRGDIGDIDLLWGNDRLGLQHIILQREKEKEEHAQEILSHLSSAIESGKFTKRNDRGNFEFVYKENNLQYKVVIAPEYQKNKITYVLTAFRRGRTNKTPQ